MKTRAGFAAKVPRTSSAWVGDSSWGSRVRGYATRKVRRKIAARARAIFKTTSPRTASLAPSRWSPQPPLPRGSSIRKNRPYSPKKAYKHRPAIFHDDVATTAAILDRLRHRAENVFLEDKSYLIKDRHTHEPTVAPT